ncbi:hypothetical protein [Metabacillus sp. FJAT-52054]|uniref:Uncharacterized protein n=1 Tax=Metabacillus sediminis TaxID=3117746 RepID=A0ABZ2NIV1_9BACI
MKRHIKLAAVSFSGYDVLLALHGMSDFQDKSTKDKLTYFSLETVEMQRIGGIEGVNGDKFDCSDTSFRCSWKDIGYSGADIDRDFNISAIILIYRPKF